MNGILQGARSRRNMFKHGTIQHSWMKDAATRGKVFSRLECATSSPTMHHKGLENTTVEEVLKMKEGEKNNPSLFWCRANDTVYNVAKLMTQNNIGSLVVLKPGEQELLAGILTERDYLKKITVQGRNPKTTKVGEIMTDENKLITVNSDTNILEAMKLMTENQIRHIPVIDAKVVGVISIVDVVRAVVEQQNEEMKRLNEFIKGKYY